MNQIDVAILSVPYTNPIPAVAPVLLSACLNEKKVSARAFDFNIEFFKEFSTKSYWPNLKTQLIMGLVTENTIPRRAIIDFLKFNKKFLINLKNTCNPKSIGLSIFSAESINYSYILIYSIRKYLPDVKIILGGKGVELTCSHRGLKHYDIYYNNGLADLVVLGDCEHVIADVVKNDIYGIYQSPLQTAEDLDARPLPSWDEYDLQVYKSIDSKQVEEPYMVITASKGCIRKCTFCDVNEFWPKYVYRSPEKVASEIISAYRNTGTKKFLFSDNLINGSVTHYRKMNEILVKEIPNTIEYSGYAIFRDKKYMPAEDFELAAHAGCKKWFVGVESGSEKVRFDMGKKITDEDLVWSIENLLKNRIAQNWLMIVGYPTETEEDFQMTLDLLENYREYAQTGLITIGINSTFEILEKGPILRNEKLRNSLGLDHNLTDPWKETFWTSTKYPDNTFPVRLDRWRRLLKVVDDIKYPLNTFGYFDTLFKEIDEMEKLYNDTRRTNDSKSKTIPIIKV